MISKTPFITYTREVASLLTNHDKFLLFINYSTKNQPIHPIIHTLTRKQMQMTKPKKLKLQNYKNNFKDPNQNHITEKSPSLTTPTKPHSQREKNHNFLTEVK